jgi:hypothetical protein
VRKGGNTIKGCSFTGTEPTNIIIGLDVTLLHEQKKKSSNTSELSALAD